jgi:hypothetical protein
MDRARLGSLALSPSQAFVGRRKGAAAGSLIAFTVVAAVARVLAAIPPAQRAARLDVLQALQYE